MNKPPATKPNVEILPPQSADTEALLQGLIREVHAIIREDVRPAMLAAGSDAERGSLLRGAIALVEIGATVGDTIGRLRGGGTPELRQRITVERIAPIQQDGEGG